MTNKQYRNFVQMQFLTGQVNTAKDIEILFLRCANLRQILTLAYLYSHFEKIDYKRVFTNFMYLASVNSFKLFYENYDFIKEKLCNSENNL